VACEDPNLLAFPVRDDLGKRVRSCFVARSGFSMCSVDFSQLEPRIVAAFSRDPKLLEMYASGRDIYQETATALGVSRLVSKILTLGIIYGMGAARLEEQLMQAGCVDSEGLAVYDLPACEALIQRWFETYPWVAEFIKDTVAKARYASGWAYTEDGRGRYLPGLFLTGDGWPAGKLREEAERQAFNHLIQGTGMEQLKKAMIRVVSEVPPRCPPDVHMLLAIHDELIFEVPECAADTYAKNLSGIISVPDFHGVELKTTTAVGPDWGSLKG